MRLGRDRWLLDDKWGTNGTYQPILITRILGAFQRVAATVGNNGGGVHNVILNAGSNGVGVRGIVTDSRNGRICVSRK